MTQVPLVGLLDSGVSVDQRPWVVAQSAFYWQHEEVLAAPASVDQLGHGRALAEVILGQAPDARLLVAQVFHDRLLTTPAQVAAALDWLVEKGAAVINMSFGLRNDRALLRDACERALDQGVVLVGASPAQGEPVYPSAYSGVLRATGDARCRPQEFSCLNSRQADFGACVRSSVANVLGASVGTAYLSGHIARYLSEGGSTRSADLYQWLSREASYWGAEKRLG